MKVIEIETETTVFVQNRTETKVLSCLIAGSVLKGQLCVTLVYILYEPEVYTSLAARERSMQTSLPKSAFQRNRLFRTSLQSLASHPTRWGVQRACHTAAARPIIARPTRHDWSPCHCQIYTPLLTQLVYRFIIGCLYLMWIEVTGDLPQCYCFVIRQREKNLGQWCSSGGDRQMAVVTCVV